MQMTQEEYLQPHLIEEMKKEFVNKYERLIPGLNRQIDDVFLEAIIIFTANYKLGKLTKLQVPVRDYIFAIALKVLVVDKNALQSSTPN
ncbi:hypothetical protein BKI52_29665 [marine bacterium AO1-C]|nr:hypothetical protein BKI52_29665 [marine bacterium AO1-C]